MWVVLVSSSGKRIQVLFSLFLSTFILKDFLFVHAHKFNLHVLFKIVVISPSKKPVCNRERNYNQLV